MTQLTRLFKQLSVIALLALMLVPSSLLPLAQGSSDGLHTIHLKSRTFTPQAGVEPALSMAAADMQAQGAGERMRVLLQFEEHPDAARRAQLENDGIRLLVYLPDYTWYASLPLGMAAAVKLPQGARWMGLIEPEDKVDPALRANLPQAGTLLRLLIIVYPDVDMGAATAAVEALGGSVLGAKFGLRQMHVEMPDAASLPALADSDLWYWIAPEPAPPQPLNDGSRAATKTDQVHALGFHGNPTGDPGSIILGMWDGGSVDPSHPGFTGRLALAESTSVVDTHATHVAGTMAGSGAGSPAGRDLRGHADQAMIVSYDFYGDIFDEHRDAIETYDIDISQNSYGPTPYGCDPTFGNYNAYSQAFDAIVTGYYTKPIAITFAAGNEQQYCDPHWTTVSPYASAKNVIAVGATNSDDKAMTSFSSWGPADDGRVKPDVVAPGEEAGGEMAIWSALGYTGWAVGDSGTILRTYGGGQDWVAQTTGAVDFYGVHGMPNSENDGVVVGASGVVSFTLNGGDAWYTIYHPSSVDLRGVYKSSASVSWMVGTGGYVFRTGGSNYVVAEDLWSICAPDDQTAWAVGDWGRIINTTDGASTWITQTSGTTSNLYGVSFTSVYTGWVVGEDDGTILHTINGGSTWISQTSPTSNFLYGVFAVDAQTAWAVGENGTILHTTNGGSTWTAQTSNTSYALTNVFAADDQTAWAVGDIGTILHTTNGGATWTAQNNPTGETLWDVFFSYSDRYGGDNWQGTSMAAPAVSGILGLMLEAYNTTYGSDPWPSTLKAILMHTAEDLGNTGPDYKFGYGHVDALAAVNLITATTSANTTYFTQDTIANWGIYTYTLYSSGAAAPVCTLVWDDYPGVSSASKALVNDLNLRLVAPSGTTHMPWTPDKDLPDDPATRGDNDVDNIEQVVATAAQAGEWSIVVRGHNVPLGPQDFSLVCNQAFTPRTHVYLPVVLNNYDPSELVQNGNFDTGTWAPWQIEGSPELDDQVYHSASYSARLAGRDNVDSDYVVQEVTVPSNATEVTVDFWYRVSSNDPSAPEDYMCVEILDSGFSTVLVSVGCFELYLEPQEQWINFQRVISGTELTPLLGQTVLVSFQGWTNATNPSTAWVEDVSFKVTP